MTHEKKQKVLASIAGFCAAGAVTSVIVGGVAIDKSNAQSKEMDSLITKTYNSAEYKSYIARQEAALYESYRNGYINIDQYQMKLSALHSIETLKQNTDRFLSAEDAKRYNKLSADYLKNGKNLAVGIVGGIATGSIAIATAVTLLEEKKDKKKEDEMGMISD